MTTVSPAELIARVQAAIGRMAECQNDHSVVDRFEALINKVLSLHDYAGLAQNAHATFDMAPANDYAMAGKIARIADNVMLTTCVDIAAIALHIASTVELEEKHNDRNR